MALLEVRELEIVLDTRKARLTAVNRISFSVEQGEILGLVGESGAGKSITGNGITGLLDRPGRIAGGEIHLDGMRIDNLPASQMHKILGKRIGVVFQDPLTSLNPLLTIGHQLIETIQEHTDLDYRQARQRAVELLQEVGIPAAEQRISHYPHQFSGGMRQRVVIALAICAKPQLIIADEPTTALDVSVQAQIIALLKRLCREHGTAVILITHDMGVIAETTDRVAVMYAGNIVELGPTRDIIHNPSHPYTIGLMKAIPPVLGEVERLYQIEGSMPRLTDIPPGCAFSSRCPDVHAKCRRQAPEMTRVGRGSVACWKVTDEARHD